MWVVGGGEKSWEKNTGGKNNKQQTQKTNFTNPTPGLCFDGEHKRLLSGSLDHHVKVYDLTSYEVVHSLKFPAPVLSVAVGVRLLF